MKKLVISVVIIATAGLGWMYFANGRAGMRSDGNGQTMKTIEAQWQFKDGKHIIAGEIELPTPCHKLDVKTTVAESYPEQVAIHFTSSFVSSTSSEVCAQVISTARFKEEFDASGYAIIRAFWNGESARLNLNPTTDLIINVDY